MQPDATKMNQNDRFRQWIGSNMNNIWPKLISTHQIILITAHWMRHQLLNPLILIAERSPVTWDQTINFPRPLETDNPSVSVYRPNCDHSQFSLDSLSVFALLARSIVHTIALNLLMPNIPHTLLTMIVVFPLRSLRLNNAL